MEIRSAEDWSRMAARRLTVVVDPMVVRAGELFLRGAKAQPDREETWQFLSKNTYALGMFFDALVLEDRVPVFDYADTFDMPLSIGGDFLANLNRREAIFEHVHVGHEQYSAVKTAALHKLGEIYAGAPRIGAELAREIVQELAQADYRWQPHLGKLENSLSPDEKALARFLLGGLIFGAYAQMIGGDHLIQPKRSRLHLAAALGAASADHQFEEELFKELRERARGSVSDMPWRPTLFPYLLSVAETPAELVAEAIAIRSSPEVVDYRHWWAEARRKWEQHGQLDAALRDVKQIAAAVDRITGAVPALPRVELKVTVADVVKPKAPGGIDFTPALASLWGWFVEELPGNRYRKMLTRAVAADQAYVRIENRVRTVWGNG